MSQLILNVPNSKIKYVAAGAEESRKNEADIKNSELLESFRSNVVKFISYFFSRYQIALSVNREGLRRGFAEQYRIRHDTPKSIGAGPGESNHNYGQAVDLGFKGLKWLHANGDVEYRDDSWLRKMDNVNKSTSQPLWDLLRSEATRSGTGLHRGPVRDRPHLQSWDDAFVKMPVRLAVLLTRVSRPHMEWERQLLPQAEHSTYACDFGFGGRKYNVGSAMEIWEEHARVTPALLDRARRGEPEAVSHAAAGAVRAHPAAPALVPALRPRETPLLPGAPSARTAEPRRRRRRAPARVARRRARLARQEPTLAAPPSHARLGTLPPSASFVAGLGPCGDHRVCIADGLVSCIGGFSPRPGPTCFGAQDRGDQSLFIFEPKRNLIKERA